MMVAIFRNKTFLIKVCKLLFIYNAIAHLIDFSVVY